VFQGVSRKEAYPPPLLPSQNHFLKSYSGSQTARQLPNTQITYFATVLGQKLIVRQETIDSDIFSGLRADAKNQLLQKSGRIW
ncbi:MAG: hypothetical protein WA151_05655, partial [Desulfatirhabdiaceae bacterium]